MASLGLVIQWGSDGWQGGPNYLKNLALAVASVQEEQGLGMVFFVSPDQVDHLAQYRNILPLADDIRVFDPSVKMDDIDVLYPFPGKGKAPEGIARVHWIPDFQHCHLPHLFSKEDLDWRNTFFAKLAKGDEMVVLSSQAALNDFRRFFDVKCPTHVLRFATSPEPDWLQGDAAAVKATYGISGDYLMCCNQFWVHKDHKTLFNALALLRDRGIRPQLVCTGSAEDARHPDYFDSLTRFLAEHDLAGQVTILGLIPRSDQIQLLRGASGVIQPSLFEGWSTVIEDCRLLGKSVVYSDIPVHLEQNIAGGAPFEAGNAESLARVLADKLPAMLPTADTPVEEQALHAAYQTRRLFGLEISNMVRLAMDTNNLRKQSATPAAPVRVTDGSVSATSDLTGRNSYKVKGVQWYAPPLAGASTLSAPLFETETYQSTLDILKKLKDDDYLRYLRGFMSSGMRRFGQRWRYADICTVLYTLSGLLGVTRYLEIGVRQGRSMAMVVSQQPQVHVTAFDMWLADYAGMENPGPDFVRAQMQALGHAGSLEFVDGNSHETLPAYFAQNPAASFDLITVDGDHSPEGAVQDLEDVLPHLRIGGAVVFDDIAHPAHPELGQVWRDVVLSRPEMSGFEYTELGYGVAFAVRMR
ncbi:class I SAM-dependent methyltransferase [Desulfovibrio mangrovi]|uniref:class I SAM-dependent methyltransferase n=1 Tax=Desulfovibrio mangrovi TaxID=2976983 RepID=UPI00224783C2|nr:class I SAM-dependent methyltransferase [Desulfovibrio mangrovi]UZP66892.1 class I SAM-dependent methyltransferase [Desulfovibrio mangrovi]